MLTSKLNFRGRSRKMNSFFYGKGLDGGKRGVKVQGNYPIHEAKFSSKYPGCW